MCVYMPVGALVGMCVSSVHMDVSLFAPTRLTHIIPPLPPQAEKISFSNTRVAAGTQLSDSKP